MLPERLGSAQLAEMAAQGATRAARLPAATMRRLTGMLASNGAASDELLVEAGFRQGAEGFPEVRLRITGTLGLVCQRCLNRLEWPVAIDVALTVVATEAEAADLADPFDSVMLAEGELRLLIAAEDEILAALPLAPVHGDPTLCRADSGAAVAMAEPANRPFAALGAMLGRRGGDD